jgi:hypothetical protein
LAPATHARRCDGAVSCASGESIHPDR